MKSLTKIALSLAFSCLLSANAGAATDMNTPYVKLSDGLYVGAYCHVSSGTTGTVLKIIIDGAGVFAGLPPEVVSLGLDRMTMKKGDVMCIWLTANNERRDRLRNENRFSRRHFIDTPENELVRTTTNYTIKVYGADRQKITEKSNTCSGHAHCFSGILQASPSSGGFTACIETTPSAGKTVSVTFGQGSAPTTAPVAKEASCQARQAEF